MPALRVVVVSIATPEPFTPMVPMTVVPSLKTTLPVGIEELLPVTCAVKVTGAVSRTLAFEVARVVVVVATFTTCVREFELAARLFPSPA